MPTIEKLTGVFDYANQIHSAEQAKFVELYQIDHTTADMFVTYLAMGIGYLNSTLERVGVW